MSSAVTDVTFQEEVLNAKGLVLVDFWAEWCTPCLMLGPILEEVEKELGTKVKVLKLNVDDNPTTTEKYQVLSIPAVKLFKNGELIENFIGLQPKQVYVDGINKNQ
jgi:thioredoxin 1